MHTNGLMPTGRRQRGNFRGNWSYGRLEKPVELAFSNPALSAKQRVS